MRPLASKLQPVRALFGGWGLDARIGRVTRQHGAGFSEAASRPSADATSLRRIPAVIRYESDDSLRPYVTCIRTNWRVLHRRRNQPGKTVPTMTEIHPFGWESRPGTGSTPE